MNKKLRERIEKHLTTCDKGNYLEYLGLKEKGKCEKMGDLEKIIGVERRKRGIVLYSRVLIDYFIHSSSVCLNVLCVIIGVCYFVGGVTTSSFLASEPYLNTTYILSINSSLGPHR